MATCSSMRIEGGGIGVHVSGFYTFSRENTSESKHLPVSNLELKRIPKDTRDSSNQTLTASFSSSAKTPLMTGLIRGMRWWENTSKHNMLEIRSAQHLVDSLSGADDRLVLVDFYSPGCGGCKSLHPKICQFADSNPDLLFLKVNQEELRTMCHSLNVHVLPFFRLYRGAEGRICSFSCTIATIDKFKKALEKHGSERCSHGPAKGLDEKELLGLASAGELAMNLSLPSSQNDINVENLLNPSLKLSRLFSETEEQQQNVTL